MNDCIRFHLDENVDPDIALALRRQSIDVSTTVEMGLRGQTDEAQLAFACQQGRVIVTHDTDFSKLPVKAQSIGVLLFVKRMFVLSERLFVVWF